MNKKIINKNNIDIRFKVSSIMRLCDETSHLIYSLKSSNRLDAILNENYKLNKETLICILIEKPIITNFNDVIKVTDNLYGFKDNKIYIDINFSFCYSNGSVVNKTYNFYFIEYGGSRAKSIEGLLSKYDVSKTRFKSSSGSVYTYDKLKLSEVFLDKCLLELRKNLLNNNHIKPYYCFDKTNFDLFVKEFISNKEREYITLLKENSESVINVLEYGKDEKERNRLGILFNRIDRIFDFYKSNNIHPERSYRMFSFYKLDLTSRRSFIYTNGFCSYLVIYKNDGSISCSCLYDLYKGSKVSDCISVLSSYSKQDRSGILELIRLSIDLRKKELTDSQLIDFKRKVDLYNRRF